MKLGCNPVDQARGAYETEDPWPIKSEPQQPVEPSEMIHMSMRDEYICDPQQLTGRERPEIA